MACPTARIFRPDSDLAAGRSCPDADASPLSCARFCCSRSAATASSRGWHIRLDGHQHIHLVPLVLDAVLDLARSESITWVRTSGSPCRKSPRLWWRSLQTRSDQVDGSAAAERAGDPTPAPGRLQTNRRLCCSVDQCSEQRSAGKRAPGPDRASQPVVLQADLEECCVGGMDQAAISAVCGLFQLPTNRQKGVGFSALEQL